MTVTPNEQGEWESRKFVQALSAEKLPRRGKLQARDYLSSGSFPVIDQGRNEIAGWTDDESLVIDSGLPYVVFGDHTRSFKYVDRAFALGADGTQLLKPSADYCPRFFYYACLRLDLPSRGYNRHYTFLKEKDLPRPPRGEQEKIAAILWKLQRAIAIQDRLLNAARDLKQSAMQQLFTHGMRGEPLKDTEIGAMPESWSLCPVGKLGQIVTGSTPKTSRREYYADGALHFIAPGDMGSETEIRFTVKKVTEAGMQVSRVLPQGSTCVVCIGSSIGKVGITTQERSTTNQQINAIVPSMDFDPHFVCYLLQYHAELIASRAAPSPVPILSKSQFSSIELPVTLDPAEQRDIAAALATIDRKLAHHRRKRAALDDLFQTTLHQLMTAQIRVADLDIDTSEVADQFPDAGNTVGDMAGAIDPDHLVDANKMIQRNAPERRR